EDVAHLVVGVVVNLLELGEHLPQVGNRLVDHDHVARRVALLALELFETLLDQPEQLLLLRIGQAWLFEQLARARRRRGAPGIERDPELGQAATDRFEIGDLFTFGRDDSCHTPSSSRSALNGLNRPPVSRSRGAAEAACAAFRGAPRTAPPAPAPA